MEIILVPNKILNTKTEPVKKFDSELKNLVQGMKEILSRDNVSGAGLSAPQVGVLKQVFIAKKFFINPTGKEESIDFAIVNPQIISQSKQTATMFEGCLSIPNTFGKVERARKVTIKYQDENGELKKLKADGFFATVIQHEYDHLQGILFTSKIIGGPLNEDELDELIKKERNL